MLRSDAYCILENMTFRGNKAKLSQFPHNTEGQFPCHDIFSRCLVSLNIYIISKQENYFPLNFMKSLRILIV